MRRIFHSSRYIRFLAAPILLQSFLLPCSAQTDNRSNEVEQLKDTVRRLEERVAALEEQTHSQSPVHASIGDTGPQAAAALTVAAKDLHSGPYTSLDVPSQQVTASSAPVPVSANPAAALLPAYLSGGATLNYLLDGYYEYNFNQPIGRVNYLRAYDVLSNAFSINQADIAFELAPDLSAKWRYGMRVDLQFGQATDTLQGNPANETRPDVYRNIFQAYGTYIVPVGKGLTVDFGKWASSLGIEGNYAKDQMNYSRSFYFYFLPFYHSGVRVNYKFNDRIAANYWVVNGTNQSEPTNSFKDELWGLSLQPHKTVSWTVNYYLGQDHPDSTASSNCTVPVQPGLCLQPILPAPNGRLHIFDSYVSWQATSKLTLAGEGDYFIEREWINAAPGESSAPAHVDGGALYAQYQINPRTSVTARGEYLSDRGGLFSGATQALKESTFTYKYTVADGLDAFLEFRRDWTNRNYFLTQTPGVLSDHQNTAALGLVWWYGGKQGAW